MVKNYHYTIQTALELTWPQVWLLLDAAAFNAPMLDDDDGKPEVPPKPNLKTQPVEYLRWFHLYHPGVPQALRKNKEEIDSLCARFEADIAAGKRVWNDRAKDWVDPKLW